MTRFRAPDPLDAILDVGTTYELVLRVRATCRRREAFEPNGHGRCYAVVLEQRDFTAERAVPVWLDQDEILVAVPGVPHPDPAARALAAAEELLARGEPIDGDLAIQHIARILRGEE